ncbi:hypothetical protein [Sorangium sp. So ce117]|uniref:hypothetical protein n=1 Tax=Sorangium sp. So ce117 TaxID=3133277 RepID=UPI003F5F04D4
MALTFAQVVSQVQRGIHPEPKQAITPIVEQVNAQDDQIRKLLEKSKIQEDIIQQLIQKLEKIERNGLAPSSGL